MKYITNVAALFFVLALYILSGSRYYHDFMRKYFPKMLTDKFDYLRIFITNYDSYSAEVITNQALSFRNKRQNFFYNKVGKCGSTSTWELFKKIQNFTIFFNPSFKITNNNMINPINMPSPQNFSAKYLQTQAPSMVFLHHNFIDFSSYGLENPIYINVVRQPFKRFVSLFNFLQTSELFFVPRNLTISECISTNMTLCGQYCSNT